MSDHTNAVGFDMPAQKKDRTVSIKHILTILVPIAPALFFYEFYNVFTTSKTAYFSFLDRNGIMSEGWVGWDNWVRLIHDPSVWNALKNNLILVVTSIYTQLPGALILALLIDSRLKGVQIYKAFWFLSVLLSTSATGIPWNLTYDPSFGLLQAVLRGVGKENLVESWLGEPAYVLPCAFIVTCWIFIPFYMILLKAGLISVPGELMGSAKLDGASSRQRFWNVALPFLLSTIRTVAPLNIAGSLKYFGLIWVMTGGRPNSTSELVATYLHKQGIQGWNMGYTSATASFLFLFCGAFTIVYCGTTLAFGEIGGGRSRRLGGRKTG